MNQNILFYTSVLKWKELSIFLIQNFPWFEIFETSFFFFYFPLFQVSVIINKRQIKIKIKLV